MERLIERFAPENEDELALVAHNAALPAWVLVATNRCDPERALIVPLQDLNQAPYDELRGWAPLAVVGLDCDVAYVSGVFGPGEISISELLGW